MAGIRFRHQRGRYMMKTSHSRSIPAFSLLDVTIAMAIIGTAIVALMVLLASGTKVQGEAGKASSAIRLAQNLHEYALTLNHNFTSPPTGTTLNTFINEFNFVDEFNHPAVIDASGKVIDDPSFSGWSQSLQVTPLDPDTLLPVTVTQDSDWAWRPKLVSAKVSWQGSVVYKQSWILAPALQS